MCCCSFLVVCVVLLLFVVLCLFRFVCLLSCYVLLCVRVVFLFVFDVLCCCCCCVVVFVSARELAMCPLRPCSAIDLLVVGEGLLTLPQQQLGTHYISTPCFSDEQTPFLLGKTESNPDTPKKRKRIITTSNEHERRQRRSHKYPLAFLN